MWVGGEGCASILDIERLHCRRRDLIWSVVTVALMRLCDRQAAGEPAHWSDNGCCQCSQTQVNERSSIGSNVRLIAEMPRPPYRSKKYVQYSLFSVDMLAFGRIHHGDVTRVGLFTSHENNWN